jgi:trimethylamine---corrinoid protein Co-methyltransferase
MRTNRRRPVASAPIEPVPVPIYQGGRYRPLDDAACERIIECAFTILQRIGIGESPPWLAGLLCAQGAKQRVDGRVTFPRQLVENALRRASHKVALPGFAADRGLDIGAGKVHIGTGGAAVQVLDSSNGKYRDSTLADLYRMMRTLDHCEQVHYGVRPLVARDMPTPLDLDVNTAYACLRATSKPIGVSFDNAAHVVPVCRMFDLALGREDGFRKQPFCFGVIVHVVPPLKFASEGVDIMRAAIEAGMPLQICSAGQAGATSPAALAGALAQGLAESLAGMMVVDAISPGHACIYAFMPFISDLRTGAMTGGSGESAVANAAAAQLLLRLELPSTVSAGMTDSKLVDAQAGYEKGYSVALAAQAGADMINLSVGMLGSIMVASPEALVIDNDMCGAILRTVRGIEVSDELLDLDAMERVVSGEGHYLGEAQTLALMKTAYVYPELGDRKSVSDWIDAGAMPIWERARKRVDNILQQPQPCHLSAEADEKIRRAFDIKLNPEAT